MNSMTDDIVMIDDVFWLYVNCCNFVLIRRQNKPIIGFSTNLIV